MTIGTFSSWAASPASASWPKSCGCIAAIFPPAWCRCLNPPPTASPRPVPTTANVPAANGSTWPTPANWKSNAPRWWTPWSASVGFPAPPVHAIQPSPRQFGYRNHARMTVGPDGALGFVNRETRRFVRVDNCMLMHPGVNHILGQLQDNCAETTQLSIRAGENTGDFLIQPTLKSPDVPLPTGPKTLPGIGQSTYLQGRLPFLLPGQTSGRPPTWLRPSAASWP